MRATLRTVRRSAGFYPITGLYFVGVAIALVAASGHLDLVPALIIFAFSACLSLLLAAWREVRQVHALVNGQRAELLARIDELAALLVEARISVPAQGEKEQDARDDVRRKRNSLGGTPEELGAT